MEVIKGLPEVVTCAAFLGHADEKVFRLCVAAADDPGLLLMIKSMEAWAIADAYRSIWMINVHALNLLILIYPTLLPPTKHPSCRNRVQYTARRLRCQLASG